MLHVGPQVPIHKLRKTNCPVERESNSQGHKRFVHDGLFLSNRRHSPRCGSSLIVGHGGPAGAVISYVLEPGSNTCYYSNLLMKPRSQRRELLGFTSSTVHIACTYLMVKFLWPFLRLFSPPHVQGTMEKSCGVYQTSKLGQVSRPIYLQDHTAKST